MRFKPPDCKRLQGAADARRRARRRTVVLQVPDNKADAVPCERLPISGSAFSQYKRGKPEMRGKYGYGIIEGGSGCQETLAGRSASIAAQKSRLVD
jgi:hypothetical protein